MHLRWHTMRANAPGVRRGKTRTIWQGMDHLQVHEHAGCDASLNWARGP